MKKISISCFIILFPMSFAFVQDYDNSHFIQPGIYSIQTNVTDLDQAVDFYQMLGFDLITRDYYPEVAPMLNEETMLTLHKAGEKILTDPDGSRTVLNMAVKSLKEILQELEPKGIEVIHEETQLSGAMLHSGILSDWCMNCLRSIVISERGMDVNFPKKWIQ